MSAVFAITSATDNVELDPTGVGEVPFTVSNVSGRTLRGRAEARVPSDPARQNWLKVAGETERPFAKGATQQVVVRIQAPPGSVPGKYFCRLDMISVENPDEDFSQGPSVSFAVMPPAVAKRPFPWWIVAVAAALLLIVGVTVWLLKRPQTQAATVTPASTLVPAPAQLAANTILGVLTDNTLATRAGVTADWVAVPNSGSIVGVTVLQNGTIVGVGTDRQLYTRSTLTSPWALVQGSGLVSGVTHTPGGTLIGIGTDQQLWTRQTLAGSSWVQAPSNLPAVAVTQLSDGRILGIGPNQQLIVKSSLASPWMPVPNSGSVRSVAQAQNGAVLGVGTDDQLYTWSGTSWIQNPATKGVTSIATLGAAPGAATPSLPTEQPAPAKPHW